MTIERTNLKHHFPLIRDRMTILDEISSSVTLSAIFNSWSTEQQNQFLDMCTGVRGIKILYDSFFKEIFNPDATPERLSALLSQLLKRTVTVKEILPNDGSRLGDDKSLTIADIVVKLEDGSLANVEVQKIGYLFPGERASCYCADLLLRQYKRVRAEKKELFTYKDLNPVYTIIFMENSPACFKEFTNNYIHYISEKSDTGINLRFLQNFIFVPVDIFMAKLHNNGINSELDAWLTFMGCDEPEYIIKLIEAYPKFKPMYTQLYDMCLNIEGVMNMFSKELQTLDRNTVIYMIDELQEQLDERKSELDDTTTKLSEATAKLDDTTAKLDDTTAKLDDTTAKLDEANATIQKFIEKYGPL